VGIACSRIDQKSPETLLNAADLALYDAKRAGRNRIALAS
jgi:PleD family two-component response regulator